MRLVLVALVAALFAACTPAPDTNTDAGALHDFLEAWSRALLTADAGALADLVDTTARPELLDEQVQRASALAAVPLADFGYELGTELSPPSRSPGGGDPVHATTVHVRYAVAGVDSEPTRKQVTVLLVRRDGHWKLLDDRPWPGSDTETWRAPWDHGPLVARTVDTAGGTSVVLGHPDRTDLVDDVAAALPEAIETVSAVWGPQWPRRALVLVTSTTDEFVDQVGAELGRGDVAGAAVADAVDPEHGSAVGQRVVLGPDAADRLTGVALNVVLRHELTHIAARGRTVDGSPMWILEGTADYIGYLPVTATPLTADDLRRHAPETVHRIVHGDAPSALPADEDFADPARTLAAYEMSWTLAAHIAARFGSGTLVELYTALARGPVPPSETDRILVDVLGIPARDLVEQWHGRLEAVLGG